MDERLYWLGFALFSGIGPKRFQLLLETFGSAKDAWEAEESALAESGIGSKNAQTFVEFRKGIAIQRYADVLEKKRIAYVCLYEDTYPSLLKQISNPPFVLFYSGALSAVSSEKTIAIVGTRNITSYGETVTRQLTAALVGAGYTIISGLAFGVDAVAHRTTLREAGTTVAVLGCGIDCCSPTEHSRLYEEIVASGGAIVSEYPLGITPSRGSFPARNRIIAGLSQAVVVTEGSASSGALYTAKTAFALDRPVFAVPGPITSSLSKGPFSLLAQGGQLVTSIDDILTTLMANSDERMVPRSITGDTEEEQWIIDSLMNEELLFDEISKKVHIDPAQLGILLSMMELKGQIKRTPAGYFILAG